MTLPKTWLLLSCRYSSFFTFLLNFPGRNCVENLFQIVYHAGGEAWSAEMSGDEASKQELAGGKAVIPFNIYSF